MAEANVPEGYTSEVVQNGMLFTVTNTYEEVPEEETPLPGPEEPEVPDEPEKPDVPQDDVEIDEPEVPPTDVPEEDEPEAELEEEEVPLINSPKTSDSTSKLLWMMMTLLSATVLVGIRIAERKER